MSITEQEIPAQIPNEEFAHDVQMSDRLVVSRDGSFTDQMPGFAGRVHGRFVDVCVLGMGGRPIWYPDSLHADDPWIKSRPHLFDDVENRAIFRLAPSEEELRAIRKDVSAIRDTIDQYIAEAAVRRKQKDST